MEPTSLQQQQQQQQQQQHTTPYAEKNQVSPIMKHFLQRKGVDSLTNQLKVFVVVLFLFYAYQQTTLSSVNPEGNERNLQAGMRNILNDFVTNAKHSAHTVPRQYRDIDKEWWLTKPIDSSHYTVRVNSWKRQKALNVVINHLLTCDAVAQIQIVWCIAQGPVPGWLADMQRNEKFESSLLKNATTIPRVVVEEHEDNSLNARFHILSEPPTAGILSQDDDILRPCPAMDAGFALFTLNPNRMVGYDARRHLVLEKTDKGEQWGYSYTKKQLHNEYSFVLTKYAFLHKNYLRSYTSRMPKQIRTKVKSLLNCEDIAMALWVASQTKGQTALLADKWALQPSLVAIKSGAPISESQMHLDIRGTCVEEFASLLKLKGDRHHLQLSEYEHRDPREGSISDDKGADDDGSTKFGSGDDISEWFQCGTHDSFDPGYALPTGSTEEPSWSPIVTQLVERRQHWLPMKFWQVRKEIHQMAHDASWEVREKGPCYFLSSDDDANGGACHNTGAVVAGLIRSTSEIQSETTQILMELSCDFGLPIYIVYASEEVAQKKSEYGLSNDVFGDSSSMDGGETIKEKRNLMESRSQHNWTHSIWSMPQPEGCAGMLMEQQDTLLADFVTLPLNRETSQIQRLAQLRDAQRQRIHQLFFSSHQKKVNQLAGALPLLNNESAVILIDLDLAVLPKAPEIAKRAELLSMKNGSEPSATHLICSAGNHIAMDNRAQKPFYYDTFSTILYPDTFVLPLEKRMTPRIGPQEDPNLIPIDSEYYSVTVWEETATNSSDPVFAEVHDYTQYDLARYLRKAAWNDHDKLFPIRSCFGGLALFKAGTWLTPKCQYSLAKKKLRSYQNLPFEERQETILRYASKSDLEPCEHVVFHECLHEHVFRTNFSAIADADNGESHHNSHLPRHITIDPTMLTQWKPTPNWKAMLRAKLEREKLAKEAAKLEKDLQLKKEKDKLDEQQRIEEEQAIVQREQERIQRAQEREQKRIEREQYWEQLRQEREKAREERMKEIERAREERARAREERRKQHEKEKEERMEQKRQARLQEKIQVAKETLVGKLAQLQVLEKAEQESFDDDVKDESADSEEGSPRGEEQDPNDDDGNYDSTEDDDSYSDKE